jgi:hypothetical protein
MSSQNYKINDFGRFQNDTSPLILSIESQQRWRGFSFILVKRGSATSLYEWMMNGREDDRRPLMPLVTSPLFCSDSCSWNFRCRTRTGVTWWAIAVDLGKRSILPFTWRLLRWCTHLAVVYVQWVFCDMARLLWWLRYKRVLLLGDASPRTV